MSPTTPVSLESEAAPAAESLELQPLGPAQLPTDKARADRTIFEAMRAGRLPAAVGLAQVAHSSGWPLRVPEGWLCAAPAGELLAVAGDHNGWQPTPMTQEGSIQFAVLPDRAGALRYKLVNPRGEFFADPWSRNYCHDDQGEMSMLRGHGARLVRWPSMGQEGLLPRTVRIWLPRDKPTHHLYVHDGQNLFDPRGPHGGWRLHQTVGPNTAVIGLDTTAERREELTFCRDRVGGHEVGGKAPQYAEFLRNQVQPMVESELGRPRKVGVMGSSLGGLMAFYQALRFPNAYDFVGSLSGTFGWGAMSPESHGDTLVARFSEVQLRRPVLYLDSGGTAEEGTDNYHSNRKMADVLSRNHRWGEQLHHWHQRGAPHNEAAWAERAHRPVRLFESL